MKKIINLVKSIIFPDYFNKRQCHETIRSYNIGVHMEELLQTLARQISYGLQFGEKSEAITTRQQVQDKARDLALQLIDALPEDILMEVWVFNHFYSCHRADFARKVVILQPIKAE